MSLGTLKFYNIIVVLVMSLFFASCVSKTVVDVGESKEDKIQKLEKIQKIDNNIEKKKEIILSKVIPKKIIPKKNEIKQVPAKKIVKVNTNNDYKVSKSMENKKFNNLEFDFIKKGKLDNNTLLIVGGIQGDEPGGFMAASLIATHYDITRGSVWIVPNLNFYSIIKRSRGPFGDMNRKFASLPKSDPEYKIIQRIKSYISNKDVSLILNLHDGSGYYRPMYIDKNHRPGKWGQTIVIDQEVLPHVKRYANTYDISEEVIRHLNKNLLKKEDIYRTKNTHTRFKKSYVEQEMAKTLTYYAVTNGKSAFGHETSKDLTLTKRVYYKLLAIEKFMDIMNIKYKRKFPMTLKGITKVLNKDIHIKFRDTNIVIPLDDIRNIQKYFPINKDGVVEYFPSNPMIKIIKKNNYYNVYYGNRKLTTLEADYAEHLNFKTNVNYVIDGKTISAKFGDTIDVNKSFLIGKNKKFRVNAIGYKHKSGIETNVTITQKEFLKQYSVEKNGNIYRIEYYKNKRFAGMILVRFRK